MAQANKNGPEKGKNSKIDFFQKKRNFLHFASSFFSLVCSFPGLVCVRVRCNMVCSSSLVIHKKRKVKDSFYNSMENSTCSKLGQTILDLFWYISPCFSNSHRLGISLSQQLLVEWKLIWRNKRRNSPQHATAGHRHRLSAASRSAQHESAKTLLWSPSLSTFFFFFSTCFVIKCLTQKALLDSCCSREDCWWPIGANGRVPFVF